MRVDTFQQLEDDLRGDLFEGGAMIGVEQLRGPNPDRAGAGVGQQGQQRLEGTR